MAEKYYSISPYVYCADNPVNKIDPDGRSEWPVNRTYNGNGRRHENNWHASRPRRRKLKYMNRKYLFTIMLIVGHLLSSCNGTKNKINNDKVRDSIGVDFSAQSTQVKKRHKVIHSEAINIDSIIGSYHVLYKTQDNGQIVTTYPITDGKGKDTVCYASQDLILTINKDGKNILLNRKIQLDDFRSFIPKNERHKYCRSGPYKSTFKRWN